MSSILRFLFRQNVPLNITFIAIMFFGIFISLPNIPVDQFPAINFNKCTITTIYPGASPENVERLVTEILESSIRDMEGIEFVRSTSITGLSVILIQFQDDVDFDLLYDDLRMRALGIQNTLPIINGKSLAPGFTINDVNEWIPVIQVNLQHTQEDAQHAAKSLTLLAKELRALLEEIPHVKNVLLFGVENEQYEISIDPEALERHSLTLQDCLHALRQSGHVISGGNVQTIDGELGIILDDVAESFDDIFKVVIRTDGNGNHITLRSIIDWEHTGIRHIRGNTRTSFDGKNNASCKVVKTERGNASTIKRHVLEICNTFMLTHIDDGIEYHCSLDSTISINANMNTLAISLIAACVLVVLTLFWFLGNTTMRSLWIGNGLAFVSCAIIAYVDSTAVRMIALTLFMFYIFYYNRSSVLIFSGIVFSFIGSIIFFDFAGYSLNELTLLGFVITIGIIVDDAIIILENIRRHHEAGEAMHIAAVNGTAEVFWPVLSASFTTLAAFLPMLLMTGSTGEFFSLVPIAVSIALFISLIECIIFLPLHTVDLSKLLGEEETGTHGRKEYANLPELSGHMQRNYDRLLHLTLPGMTGYIHRSYDRLLHWVFDHPLKTFSLIACMILLSMTTLYISNPKTATELGISPPLRVKFFPSNTNELWIRVSMPHGSSADSSDINCRDIAKLIGSRPAGQVAHVTTLSSVSIDSAYNIHHSHQSAFIIVELVTGTARSFTDPHKVMDDIDQELQRTFHKRGLRFFVEARKDGPPVGNPVSINITGADDAMVAKLTHDLFSWMKSEMHTDGLFAGVKNIYHDREQIQDRLQFHFDDHKLANFSMSPLQAQIHLSTMFDGAWVGNMRQKDEDIPIRIKISASHTRDIENVLSLPISNDSKGRVVRFHDIGSATMSSAPSVLIRKQFQRSITINGTLRHNGLYSSDFVEDWYQQHKDNYPGASIRFGGEAAGTSRSYYSLMVSFILAAFLIYTILAAQFKSYLQPIIIMSNILFSCIGVVLVMALFGIGAQLLGPSIVRPERSWFTMQCVMAVIGLAGLVVNDAIVLIDFINQRRRDGMELHEAIFTASHQRVRAIIMTTVTTIAGLMPMAIGLPEFSLRWSPFATAFIAGLTVSTTMTLLVLPLLYAYTDTIRNRSFTLLKSLRTRSTVNTEDSDSTLIK